MASLELDLLGGFGARFGTGEPLAPLGRKAQLLLAFLALRAGEAQTREKVIGILWSDRGETQARGSLRQELTVLRKAMGGVDPAAIVIEGERLSARDQLSRGIHVKLLDPAFEARRHLEE